MTSNQRRGPEDLTESWEPLEQNHDRFSDACSDDGRPVPPPQASLTASRLDNLGDAFGRMPQQSRSQVRQGDRTNDTPQQRLSASVQGEPRRRQAASSRPTDEPSFVMPSMQHEVDFTEDTEPNMRASASRSQPSTKPQKAAPGPCYDRTKAGSRRQTRRSKKAEGESPDYLTTLWSTLLSPGLQYAFSIIQLAFFYAKPIIAYALAIYLLLGGFIFAKNLLFSSVSSALSPICHIPGTGYLNLPFCDGIADTSPAPPVEFNKLISAQAAFEDVLSTSAGGASLPLDMKRSEASIRDLKHVVQYSTLPSRNELVFEFTGFVDTARQAAADLTKYNTRIGRAVDRILTTNRWTLQVLDGIADSEASQGRLTRFASKHLNIFAPFQEPSKLPQNIVFEQYVRHTSAIEEQIHTLITEAQALLLVLTNLDDRLDLIADIAERDGVKAQDNRDMLFSTLWTKLGGNRQSVQKVQRQLSTLQDIGQYRKMAYAHVSGTLIKLQAIAANLEDLRERVARPEVIGIREDIPLEMHVREIVMGVERLEEVRNEGRRIEGQRLRSILDKDERLGLEA